MNVLLADLEHRVIKIPASSIRSIVGVAHAKLPDDREGTRAIVRYDYGAGAMFAWVRTPAEQVMQQVAKQSLMQPTPWVPLKTPDGDEVFIPASSMLAIHEMDPDETGGATSRVDFDAFGNGTEVKFVLAIETAIEIEHAQAVAEQSIADRIAPAAAAPRAASKPRRQRR